MQVEGGSRPRPSHRPSTASFGTRSDVRRSQERSSRPREATAAIVPEIAARPATCAPDRIRTCGLKLRKRAAEGNRDFMASPCDETSVEEVFLAPSRGAQGQRFTSSWKDRGATP